MTLPEDSQYLLGGEERKEYNAVNSNGDISKYEDEPFGPGRQIQDQDIKTKVYKRRWYVMIVYGIFAMTQCAVWNTFSPISAVGERVFNWNTADLSLLTNWGPISYLVATFAVSWILDERGLRPACLLSAFFVAVGTGLRCITTRPAVASPLIHLGQLLNGFAGPIAMGAAPALSSEWFPPEQRTTATGIATLTNTLGLAVSFLLGPYLVPVQKIETTNMTLILNYTMNSSDVAFPEPFSVFSTQNHTFNYTTGYDVDTERDLLMRYMYYSFGWSVFSFLLFFTYFPSKPPLPPSPTASMDRLSFKSGVKKLARNRTFWLVCFTYGLALGIMGCWNGVLDVNLKDHNIAQDEAAWLGFYGVMAGCVALIIVARCADIFSKHMKWFLVGLFVLGGGCLLVFSFSLVGIVPDTTVIIYSSYIIGNLILYATTPLFFEMACEVSYPVAEGVTCLVLTLVNNIAGLLFLFVQMIPNIGTMWENWSLVGAIFLCVPVLLLLKERYNRLDIDIVVGENKENEHCDISK